MHPILNLFSTSVSLISELSRVITCENLFLICYLCDQHDFDTSIPALLFLTKKLPAGVELMLDRATVLDLVSEKVK